MIKKIDQAIFTSFAILFFLLPLIVIPVTSELFEFNKIVFIYLFTSLIASLWIARMLISKKINFQKTFLDFPLIIFLTANIISTIFSIDKSMSIFGYYSRFNGGLFSLLAYTILYWAFVSNIKKESAVKIIKTLISSSILVCTYATLQKAGIDKNIWVQDVQNRVFSSLGQPNWLAAWLVLIFFLPFGISRKEKRNFRFAYLITLLYFLVLLFTKSRSGLLGFGVSWATFWLGIFLPKEKQNKLNNSKNFLYLNILILIIIFLIGTPWTPSFSNFVSKKETAPIPSGTALETGGTESGEIRKIVWKGAIKIWQSYPIFGSGPETFALSYFRYKPQEHNLTSEWNFIYNKAHNEYLNYLANTGLLGFISYIILIISSLIVLFKNSFPAKIKNNKEFGVKTEHLSLLAGEAGFLITNIFGFSVVATSFLFFLYPAISFCLTKEDKTKEKENSKEENILLAFPLLISAIATYTIINYWRADLYYNQGKNLNINKNYSAARNYLIQATKLNPYEPTFLDELSKSTFSLAINAYNKNNKELTQQLANQSLNEINQAIQKSPYNITFRKDLSAILIQLSIINPNFKEEAINSLLGTIPLAPTDPKIYYNLGLLYFKSKELDKAKENFEKSIELKSNYRDAHLALASLYSQINEKEKAKEELNYILQNINPNDETAKRQLEELK